MQSMAQNYKEEDEAVKEAYEDYEKIREQQTKTTAKSLLVGVSSKVWIGLAAVVFFLAYLTFVREVVKQSTFFWFIIGLLILLMILGAQRESEKKQLIPESQLKAILYMKLKEKQRNSPTEVPNGEINMQLPSKLKKIEGIPTKYVISFKIITPSGLEKYYTGELDPYTGYILGFEERPAGFRGTEITDVSFIRTKQDQWEDRYGKRRRPSSTNYEL